MPDGERGGPRAMQTVVMVLVYLSCVVGGVAAMAWTPPDPATVVVDAVTRVGGAVSIIAGTVCAVSHPLHRWRWEMVAVWVLALSIGVCALADYPDAARAADYLDPAAYVTALDLLIVARGLDLLAFARQVSPRSGP